jgi:hypothetical protein
MTSKVYKTAQGKTIDLGTIMLRNEHVRAVGNMNVNARGDKLDSNNCVVETKPKQIQRQNARVTNVSAEPVQTSSNKSKKAKQKAKTEIQQPKHHQVETPMPEEAPQPLVAPPAQNVSTPKIIEGGLAAAIARTKEVKQELEKTRRQQQQSQGVRRI